MAYDRYSEIRGKDIVHEDIIKLKRIPRQTAERCTSKPSRMTGLLVGHNREQVAATGLSNLFPGKVLPCSPDGIRIHPIYKVRKMHTGIDFAAPIGTRFMPLPTVLWSSRSATPAMAGASRN